MATSVIKWEGCKINGNYLNPGQNKSSKDLGIATTYKSIDNESNKKSVATGTYVDMCSLSLEAGMWIIRGLVEYPAANNTGYRRVAFNVGSNTYYSNTRPSPSGYSTIAYGIGIITLSSTTTVKLKAYHNSGSNLTNVYGRFYAHKLN